MIILYEKKRVPGIGLMSVWLFSLFLLGYFLRAPALAAASAARALQSCASGLIPALFPFIVLVGIINRSGMTDALSKGFGKTVTGLFGLPPAAFPAILLGALGGFPIGAVCARELHERGVISREDAERLCSFTNNASPAFCIGGIGTALYGDSAFGIRLYFCQILSALLIGLAQRKHLHSALLPKNSHRSSTISEIFTHAVTDGGLTMLKICSFSVFFAVIGDAACGILETNFGTGAAALSAGICELTLASRRCASLPTPTSEILSAFAVGYAGLSVHMQVSAVLSGSEIRLGRYHICKLLQGLLSACFMAILAYRLPR